MKSCVLIVSGAPAGRNLHEVELQPGTTAGDVLRAVDLPGYVLSREGSAQVFAAEEDLYAVIEDGMKLRAAPVAEVGGVWDSILEGLGIQPRRVTVRPPSVRRRPPSASSAGGSAVRVVPDQRPLWEVRGWRREGEKLVGAFRTPRRAFAGEISLADPRRPAYFIINPPKSVLSGAHGACFRRRGLERFFIHFGLANPELDAGIVAVENLLAQAVADS